MTPIIENLQTIDNMHHHASRLAYLLDAAGTRHGDGRGDEAVGALLGLAEDMAIALRDALEAAELRGSRHDR